ncbi:MAG: hypothetical protein AAF039_13085 [Bacteroidota bacterium]
MKKAIKKIWFVGMLLAANVAIACTIFCGKDKHGQVWAANNEDGAYSFFNYINIFPKTEHTKFGYYTLSYDSAKNGEGGGIEGGMNEAGLFYDFNYIGTKRVKDLHKKKEFPGGSLKILGHILSQMETVQEVVDFFEFYWFKDGFRSAQMHVADRYGTFAIIGPSGTKISTNERYQISTNFDICGEQDFSNTERYWRFPLVKSSIEQEEVSLESFKDICEATSIKGKGPYTSYTIYSNIQNLSTGDIWFYFTSDYKNPLKTSIQELLAKGRTSYLIRDLFPNHPISRLYQDFTKHGGQYAYEKFQALQISKARKDEIRSIFVTKLLAEDYRTDLLPFLEDYLTQNPTGHWLRSARALLYHLKGDTEKAVSIVKAYLKEVPDTSMDVEGLLRLLEGKFDDNANVTIALHGFQDAQRVFVNGLPVNFNLLVKKKGKWIGKYKLDQGTYNYTFSVDGKEVLDAKTPVTITASIYEDWYRSHQLCVDLSEQAYPTTITIRVPHKNDVVYITGNQRNLTDWSSVFRLQKTADYEREITMDLHYPAKFKFTKGDWETEAIVKGQKSNEKEGLLPLTIDKNNPTHFEITDWKDSPN